MVFKSLQEAFEIAVTKLVKQGKPCLKGKSCCYKHEGMGCIIGQIMPDNAYTKNLEGQHFSAVALGVIREGIGNANTLKWINNLLSLADCTFWDDLQATHDVVITRKDKNEPFLVRINKFAKKYGLDTTFLNDLDCSNLEF